MKEIPLTRGQYAIVDDADYEALSQHRWHAIKPAGTYYATRRNGAKHVYMHRAVLETTGPVDHINGNGLDNRRDNLRPATTAQNQWNTEKQANNTSGYKGVTYDKRARKWKAYIGVNGKRLHLGYFSTAEEAAIAYNDAASVAHGEFAYRNGINA